MKKKLLAIFAVIIIAILLPTGYLFMLRHHASFTTNDYTLEMDSVIRSLKVNGQEICKQYQLFQCEEDYQLNWKLETPIVISQFWSGNVFTVFTYSQLYTYDCYKTFIFEKGSSSFTVEITKAYKLDAFSDNNQIIADIYNKGHKTTNDTVIFEPYLTIQVLRSNPPITIQSFNPGETEEQFNFNGYADRDISYHHAGDKETVLFNVTVAP